MSIKSSAIPLTLWKSRTPLVTNQREDAGCDDDGVDVSVGVDVSAVVGVDVNGQSVSLGVGLGVDLVVASLPLTSLNS